MSNDRKASELLSKSLLCELSQTEEVDLQENMASQDANNFAKLSRLIQDSVSDMVSATTGGDPTIESGLSNDAKDRLRESVRGAQQESAHADSNTLAPENLNIASQIKPGDLRTTQTRFTLLRQIGQGGLGAVWLARDEELKRTVALKEMLFDKADSPKYLHRFQREAMITGLLEHPNVVPLYSFGFDTLAGKPFYAMRFLGKQTLSNAIEEYHAKRRAGQTESIDLHRLLNAFLDVCQAIAYAHSRGVVHRDLKPDNVALDNFGQVIVLDWGIAKIMSDGELAIQASLTDSMDTDLILTKTMAGEVVGTPLYMAPEQALGELDKVDERTDVFGLGAILYAILTGHAPHEQSTSESEGSSLSEQLKAIAESKIPFPHETVAQAPRELEAVCMRALNNHRYTRHASAKELADDVERWMAGQNEKHRTYEAMKLEANGLRVNLESCVRDFATNARFVATLPPIMGLIDSANDVDSEGPTVWRERLTTIFRGLLRSNQDFQAVTYNRIIDGKSIELVRVERQGPEGQARAVPKSRLAESPLSDFDTNVIKNKPDDVRVAIERIQCEDTIPTIRFKAGVPIFDREEEPFGLVALEGDFQRLVEKQIPQRDRTSSRIMVVSDDDEILIDDGRANASMVGTQASEAIRAWSEISQALDNGTDYDDPSNETTASRVFLCCRARRAFKIVLAT